MVFKNRFLEVFSLNSIISMLCRRLMFFCWTNNLTKDWERFTGTKQTLPGFLLGWKLVPALRGRKTPVPQDLRPESRKMACIPGPPDAQFVGNLDFWWGFKLYFECCFIIIINNRNKQLIKYGWFFLSTW